MSASAMQGGHKNSSHSTSLQLKALHISKKKKQKLGIKRN